MRVAFFSILRVLPLPHNLIFFFNFSGIGQLESEHIDPTKHKNKMKIALLLSGFAERNGSDKLLPCPLGTYVNFSISDAMDFPTAIECSECPAGRVCHSL